MHRIISYLHSFNRNFKCINKYNVVISKAYYCDKKKIFLQILEQNKKSVDETTGKETCKEMETLKFDNEEEILKIVTTEKEKDANVRSRLSKECSKLLDKKIKISSPGLNLHIDQTLPENNSWEDYMFDKTVEGLKKQPLTPILEVRGKCDGISKKKEDGSDLGPTGNRSPGVGSGSGVGSPGDMSSNRPTISAKRPVRGQPSEVLFGVIPKEWFDFFIPKTGVTGFGTFLFTFSTYLVSKEYFVLEHNYYNGLGVFFTCWGAVRYIGPIVTKYIDKEIDDYEKSWEVGRERAKKLLTEQMEDEHFLQYQFEGQLMLVEAKQENVKLQLEEEFRKRQMTVYREVLHRLDYQVAASNVRKKIFHKNLVDYVTREVRKAITPDMEKELINVSIDGLIVELEKVGGKM